MVVFEEDGRAHTGTAFGEKSAEAQRSAMSEPTEDDSQSCPTARLVGAENEEDPVACGTVSLVEYSLRRRKGGVSSKLGGRAARGKERLD